MARAAHASKVRPLKPQVRCLSHALDMVDVAGLGAAHHTVWVVMQEAEAQLGPILVIPTAGRCATLLVLCLLPGGIACLLMDALAALWD